MCNERLFVDNRPRELILPKDNKYQNCSWELQAKENQGIRLNFKHVFKRVQSYSKRCYMHDSLLQVVDNSTNNVLSTYCKYNPPPKQLILQQSKIKLHINNLADFYNDDFLIMYSNRRKYGG